MADTHALLFPPELETLGFTKFTEETVLPKAGETEDDANAREAAVMALVRYGVFVFVFVGWLVTLCWAHLLPPPSSHPAPRVVYQPSPLPPPPPTPCSSTQRLTDDMLLNLLDDYSTCAVFIAT